MAEYKRIKDLREDADKTQGEIASFLGTTAQHYGKYENGICELPFSRAIQLADYYNVSLDYIAGRSEYKFEQSLDASEICLIKMWRRLTERNKGKVEFLTESLLSGQ
ncbi:MAG: helix-turn-helix transcriptional regulator [Ruminococcaceae bacterium]|nr:helix-turn-helix transcriptional regulator [Oscillospiraceae bacterium]MBR3595567.1 helix-turn-helix transcriptional regulator [Clostridia bacterium]